MAKREWPVTDTVMSIFDFMLWRGEVVEDWSWWERWMVWYDGGVGCVFDGWDELDGRGYEYRRRLGIVQSYELYRGWWSKERLRPRAVSYDRVIGEHRKGDSYE